MASRELEINTVIVDGDFRSFKAAFSRSILGVTFRKFKRRRSEFYQHRVHNEAVTQNTQKWLYEYLLTKTNLKNLSNFKLKANITIEWDNNGKILSIKNISIVVYMKVGELIVDRIDFHKKSEVITIDLFYSEIDAASEKLRSLLPDLVDSWGSDNFDYKEHDFLTKEGKEIADAYNISRVPTVMINAENKFENPDEKALRREVQKAFSPEVVGSNPEFTLEPVKKPDASFLAKLILAK